MTEFDDALISEIKNLPKMVRYMSESMGMYEKNDEVYLRVNPDESCSIEIALWTHVRFDNLDEFIQYMEDEEYKVPSRKE